MARKKSFVSSTAKRTYTAGLTKLIQTQVERTAEGVNWWSIKCYRLSSEFQKLGVTGLEFKTVTDLDRYYRNSMRTLLDRHRLKQLSDYGFVQQAKQLDKEWDKLHHKLTRGD